MILWTVALPGSSVHGILQARVLEWVAISFSRGSSWPKDWTPDLPHCRQILYCLSHRGSPDNPLYACCKTDHSGLKDHRLLESTHLKVKILTVEGAEPVAPATFCPAVTGQVLCVHRRLEISDATSKVTRAGQSRTKVPAHLPGSRPLWLLSATVRHDLKDEFT